MRLFSLYKIRQKFKQKLLKITFNNHPGYKNFVTVSNLGRNGRLGNQLFQYAAARAYSIKHNVPIILPIEEHNRMSEFKLKCKYIEKKHLDLLEITTFKEQNHHYDKSIFKKYDKYDLDGYFQTEKYFKDIRNQLLDDLIPKKNSINNYCKKFIRDLKNNHPGKIIVSLHNRRGDNVPSKKKYSDPKLGIYREDKGLFHPLMDPNYFKNAKEKFENCIFLFFSDTKEDIEWSKSNMNDENTLFSENHDDITDLFLMKNCDHNIISNSSFSWWGAWLNENPNKKVFAPRKWFGEAYNNINLKDLIPRTWNIL